MSVQNLKIQVTTELVTIVCCYNECGILFAVPATWQRLRREDHTWWHCPNGHRQHYSGETAEAKRIRELAAEVERQKRTLKMVGEDLQLETAARQQVQRSLAATKGVLTRTKNRVAKGVCPCCTRSFANLARHMAGQHPEYAGAEVTHG